MSSDVPDSILAAVARPSTSPSLFRFSGDQGRRSQSTGMCAFPCHQEAALGSRTPRNRGKLVARPVPCDKSPLVRKPVNDQSPKSKGNAASPWHDVLTSRHSHRSSTRTPRGPGHFHSSDFYQPFPLSRQQAVTPGNIGKPRLPDRILRCASQLLEFCGFFGCQPFFERWLVSDPLLPLHGRGLPLVMFL